MMVRAQARQVLLVTIRRLCRYDGTRTSTVKGAWAFPMPFDTIYILLISAYWRGKCDFEYCKHVTGCNVSVDWHNIEVYDFLGTVHAASYTRHPP